CAFNIHCRYLLYFLDFTNWQVSNNLNLLEVFFCVNLLTYLKYTGSFHTYLTAGTVNDIADEKDRRMFQLRGEIDSIISNAVAERRFQMYYQPIYSTKEKRFLSAEALIRLKDEKYGFISPELFITVAEKNGMILQIGDFVLDEVCGFLSRCERDGLPIDYIELNLSMNQCMRPDLKENVLSYMNKYHLRPDQINLEITETAANTAQDIVEDNIIRLSEEGISFSLDDYGTGYSNLSRIMALPFHIIKLDKSLADRVDDSRMKILLKNTIRMLKEIGMEIVVEGVETKETLDQFAKLGCDFIQGYYFSKPLPEQEFVEFIRKSEHSLP
ncbi:MAG: EAL domain-containing protein, partial [Lachnospiraceae bacterium]|nr:EAL domain-containing protein [bacterium]MDY5517737.1 EAL domain-containing protein [Lachnospiraceae bacterium]